MIHGERRESGSTGVSKLECRVAVLLPGEGPNHRVIGLFRCPARLVVHDVDQTTRSVLKESKTLGVVVVWNSWDLMGDPFGRILPELVLEQTLLNEVLESFVGEVDTELIEGVGAARRVLWSRKVE